MKLRDFFQNWSHKVERPDAILQSAALPYAIVDGRMAVLLVTSRRTGKWIFPKGAIEPGMTAWDSAAKEALEEAGVQGEVDPSPIGSYSATAGADGFTAIHIDVYPLKVTTQLDAWKEKGERLRHWVTPREARRLLADPDLARLATKLEARLSR